MCEFFKKRITLWKNIFLTYNTFFQNFCGNLADKYIEYDPVIVLLDLVLLQKPAYRHLLYNSSFKSYWKLMVALILGQSFQKWTAFDSSFEPFIPRPSNIPFDVVQDNDVFEVKNLNDYLN